MSSDHPVTGTLSATLSGTVRRRSLLGAALALGGCATGLHIDTTHVSRGQDSRVLFLVLHYTVGSFERSLKQLTEGQVSSHYLVRDTPATVFRLVDESRRAWHAGLSCWKAHCGLNASSVGIEIVNPGQRDTPQGREWVPFDEAQFALVIPLVRSIVQRHQIRAERILGHGEVAPAHKVDPGPLFPWKRLAVAGLIAWPEAAEVAAAREALQVRLAGQLPGADWFQQKLATHGFHPPRHGELDEATRRILMNFQMRYRNSRFDGEPDLETAALLEVLTGPAYRARAEQVPSGVPMLSPDTLY